jgi:ferredoxin
MQTNIHPDLIALPKVQEADAILRKCVHCGFCTATCPTYQLLGDELDGPRGRIYLIKNLLEDNTISDESVVHLDRCLTCRACETTCPSGVEYGRLLDIGREFVNEHSNRPLRARLLTFALRLVVPRAVLFAPLLRLGQMIRPLLPAFVRTHVPVRMPVLHQTESVSGAKVVLAEQDMALGGSLLSTPPGDQQDAWLKQWQSELQDMANVQILTRATVFGAYDQDVYGVVERVGDHEHEPDPLKFIIGQPRFQAWRDEG